MIDKFNWYKQLLSKGVTEDECLFCCNCESSIVRGTTREHSFSLPLDADIPQTVLITYRQNDRTVLEKTIVDVKISRSNEHLIYFTLSELETRKFTEGKAEVQIRCSFKDRRAINSCKFTFEVQDVLDDKILTDTSTNYYAIDADVNAQKIEVKDVFNVVQGSDGLYKCKLTFDSTWAKFTKKAIFKDQYYHKVYTEIYEDDSGHYECLLPDILLLKPGWLNMGVAGIYNEGSVKSHKPTMWSRSIKIPHSCVDKEDYDLNLEFDKIYVYQGVSDDAYSMTTPKELEVTAATKKDLLKGYTWDGYWLNNQYHVLAIPSYLNIECEKVVQNGYELKPAHHSSDESGSYTFYYFSSKATGTFTSTYYFKEVK